MKHLASIRNPRNWISGELTSCFASRLYNTFMKLQKELLKNHSAAFQDLDACFAASARCIFVNKNCLAPHSLWSWELRKGLGTRLSICQKNTL